MRKDLRDIAIASAASRYGSEHYRGILLLVTVGRFWWLAIIPLTMGGLWWAATHLSAPSNASIGFTVAGLAVLALLYLAFRRARSPYRRRRFRG